MESNEVERRLKALEGYFELRDLVANLPWGAHQYSTRFVDEARVNSILHVKHAVLHVGIAAGKLAVLADEHDHKNTVDEPRVHKHFADVLICVARIAGLLDPHGDEISLREWAPEHREIRNETLLLLAAAGTLGGFDYEPKVKWDAALGEVVRRAFYVLHAFTGTVFGWRNHVRARLHEKFGAGSADPRRDDNPAAGGELRSGLHCMACNRPLDEPARTMLAKAEEIHAAIALIQELPEEEIDAKTPRANALIESARAKLDAFEQLYGCDNMHAQRCNTSLWFVSAGL